MKKENKNELSETNLSQENKGVLGAMNGEGTKLIAALRQQEEKNAKIEDNQDPALDEYDMAYEDLAEDPEMGLAPRSNQEQGGIDLNKFEDSSVSHESGKEDKAADFDTYVDENEPATVFGQAADFDTYVDENEPATIFGQAPDEVGDTTLYEQETDRLMQEMDDINPGYPSESGSDLSSETYDINGAITALEEHEEVLDQGIQNAVTEPTEDQIFDFSEADDTTLYESEKEGLEKKPTDKKLNKFTEALNKKTGKELKRAAKATEKLAKNVKKEAKEITNIGGVSEGLKEMAKASMKGMGALADAAMTTNSDVQKSRFGEAHKAAQKGSAAAGHVKNTLKSKISNRRNKGRGM